MKTFVNPLCQGLNTQISFPESFFEKRTFGTNLPAQIPTWCAADSILGWSAPYPTFCPTSPNWGRFCKKLINLESTTCVETAIYEQLHDKKNQVRSPKSKCKPLEHRFSPKWSKLFRLTRIPTNVWAPFPSSCLEFIDCRPPGCWSGSHSMPPGGKTRTKTREPDTIPTHCAATV